MPDNPTTRDRRIRFGLRAIFVVLLSLVFLFGWVAYHRRSGYPIQFVVPIGFQGRFKVTVDETLGQSWRFENDRNVLNVPQSGSIVVNDARPFHIWHQLTCVDTGGMSREIESGDSLYDDNKEEHYYEVR